MDWADLVTLDLSLFEEPGGKVELVKQLNHAIQNVGKKLPFLDYFSQLLMYANISIGFFYVKNFNISQDEIDRQFALCRGLYTTPLTERLKYHSANDLEEGKHSGFTPAGQRM